MTDVNGREHWPTTERLIDPRQEERRDYNRRLIQGIPVIRQPKPPAAVELRYAPTAEELIARGGLAGTEPGERWTPPTLTPMREHLLRRLGLITDPDPDDTDQE